MTEKRIKLGVPDYRFLAAVGILLLFGLLMLTSASSPTAISRYGDAYYFLQRQLAVGLTPGLIGFAFFYFFDYKKIRRFALPLFSVSVFLLAVVLIPGIGQIYGGARRWIGLAGITFQPSELAKLGLIVYLASWFAAKQQKLGSLREGFLPFIVLLGTVLGLIVLEPDLGTTMVIAIATVVLYFLSGAPLRHFFLLLVAGVAAVGGLIALAPYRFNRLLIFLKPELDPQGIGYHINQAFLAIGSGGFWGRGYGHSQAKFQYLPEASGDSIFAVIGEELGFLLSVAFIGLLVYVFIRGFKIAEHSPDDFGRYLGAGIMLWLLVQSIINIGAMLGLLPLTGLPLPFVSYGGTALAVSMAAIGIVANISRQSTVEV
ncbi:putative lipid II flippase FtsW [Candidatus Uhrbacteria bacterium CG10_big_fil_rev_8_21_14_0_10_48_11]|uniref:Probable peptidoglycan glycosyltransferase FtsW n=1 Tax=Candidatus Uhrbacteria bacterium CG10_big_fil_rev_8_21_14_0_10_48_11 TaxID=1975037 RepID=A0A2M8LEG4_9BACT|nr:MAG: putative lipid II flippase FtsW [Candidatus Uhrbacteria bacterium CG10_big_fil_rev_8_21_14_0_10_48_11]